MTPTSYPFWDSGLDQESRLENLLSLLSLEEKISFLYDLSPGIPRLGIGKYYHGNECLHGVVRPGRATVFPQAIGLAASWNPDLIHQIATAISDEARAKYHRIANYPGTYNGLLTFWSPTVNVVIDPRWGRTPETYGEDPFLTALLGVQFVKGLQGNHEKYLKVVSTPKHFVANNEEHNRFKLKPKISEKWLREYFLEGFRPLIEEGHAESIMGAYNAVFDIPCCHSQWLLQKVLRDEWGFQGYVVTDCGAITHALPYAHNYVKFPYQAAASAINAGIDLECGFMYRKGYLLKAVKKGAVTPQTIDQATRRVLRTRFRLGMFDPEETNEYTQIPFSVVGSTKHSQLALKAAQESMVLLKNDQILPLNSQEPLNIAVIGPNADVAQFGDYSGIPMNTPISPLAGIFKRIEGTKVKINYVPWILVSAAERFTTIQSKNLRIAPENNQQCGLTRKYYPEFNFKGDCSYYHDETIDFRYRSESADPSISNAQTDSRDTQTDSDYFSVEWMGFLSPDISGEYQIRIRSRGARFFQKAKFQIGSSKFATSHRIMLTEGQNYPIHIQFPKVSLKSHIHLEWKLPQYHESLTSPNFSRELTAAKTSDVVICFLGLGWGDEHEGIDRKDFALAQDQQKLVQSVYQANPNTIAVFVAGSNLAINWEQEHLPAILYAWYPGERGGDAIANVLFGDYNPAGRLPLTFYQNASQIPSFQDYDLAKGKTYWFLKDKPLYSFGFGLSYTEFRYCDLILNKEEYGTEDHIAVQAKIENIGDRQGDEVVQCYISYLDRNPSTPIKQLKAFQRISLNPKESLQIKFEIAIKDLTYWDEVSGSFQVHLGNMELQLGSASDNVLLSKKISVKLD